MQGPESGFCGELSKRTKQKSLSVLKAIMSKEGPKSFLKKKYSLHGAITRRLGSHAS